MVVQAQLDLPFPKKLGYGLKILETRSKREYVQVLRPLESFPFGEVEAAVRKALMLAAARERKFAGCTRRLQALLIVRIIESGM